MFKGIGWKDQKENKQTKIEMERNGKREITQNWRVNTKDSKERYVKRVDNNRELKASVRRT